MLSASPLRASPSAAGAGHIWRLGGAWHTFGYLAACEHPGGRASLGFPLPLHPLLPRPPPSPSAPGRGPAGWRAQPGSASAAVLRPGEHGKRAGSAARPTELTMYTQRTVRRRTANLPPRLSIISGCSSRGHRGTSLQLPQQNQTTPAFHS